MMDKFTFHVVSLPHTQTTSEYSGCAYTAKVVKFCQMMKSLGHTVYLYASEDNEAPCDELITVITKEEQVTLFGEYDHHSKFFNIDWNVESAHWGLSNLRAIAEMQSRLGERDYICLIGGVCQKPIADAFPKHLSVEFGIGYTGVFANHRVFESYAWMHYVHGLLGNDNGTFYDCVIPNYFDVDQFPYSAEKDDYFLFLGRLIDRKGPQIAVEATRRIGAKLKIAGQGADEMESVLSGDLSHVEHVGFADVKKRGELMSRARAVFVPTTYLEPFGGVSIEAMMCGTPVIATDFGAFPENVVDGVTGFRFRTLGEAVWAAEHAQQLNPRTIREYAVNNFGLERVKWQYQAYFEQLATLWEEDGWYSTWNRGVLQYRRYSRL